MQKIAIDWRVILVFLEFFKYLYAIDFTYASYLLPDTYNMYLAGLKGFCEQGKRPCILRHPQLCKVIGFYSHEGSDQRTIVYERLVHGSLDEIYFLENLICLQLIGTHG